MLVFELSRPAMAMNKTGMTGIFRTTPTDAQIDRRPPESLNCHNGRRFFLNLD
jgi:hypothetical protein